MIFDDIRKVPFEKNRAIIINVGTRLVTTLSLLAAIRNAGIRVLLIDCKYKDTDDWNYFKVLNNTIDFDLISLPLKEHGKTLDYVFENINADNILLIDSDLELKNDRIVPYMLSVIENPSFFGCGFRHGGWPLKACVDYGEKSDGYYEERMWIPFVLLKVSCIRKALSEGASFRSLLFFNLFPKHQAISRKIVRTAKGKLYFKFLDFQKRTIHETKPLVVLYDTGAKLYNHLRYKSHLFLAGMDAETGIEDAYLKHFNGVTRKVIFDDNIKTFNANDEAEQIRMRLLNEYEFDFCSF